jgi:hypothetical protein
MKNKKTVQKSRGRRRNMRKEDRIEEERRRRGKIMNLTSWARPSGNFLARSD